MDHNRYKFFFKKFEKFLLEDEDMTTFLKMKTKEKEPEIDKEKEAEMEKLREDKHKTCPRCGLKEGDCECPEKDFYSTINAYRIPKGQKIQIKEMLNLNSFQVFEKKKEETDFKYMYSAPNAWWTKWQKANEKKYDFHHIKSDLSWNVFTKNGIHLMTYDYDSGSVYTDEPLNFLEF